MWRILQHAAADPTVPQVLCVLDALDECREHDRQQLISLLCRLPRQISPSAPTRQLKFLVTSRPYDSVQRWFEPTTSRYPHIRLRGEDENEQIHQEVNLVIDKYVNDLSNEFVLSQSTQEGLRRQLVQMQHRTYLWLYLAMDEVREAYQNSLYPDTVAIDSLPQSVEDAYDRLLQKINQKQKSTARQVLSIIVGARRPLKVGEMAWALASAQAQRLDSKSLVAPDIKHLERQIRHWCGLFVFIQHSTLFLIHQTAKEFLVSHSTNNLIGPDAWRGCLNLFQVELEMVRLCTYFLCFAYSADEKDETYRLTTEYTEETDKGIVIPAVDSMAGFTRYCVENWPTHLQDDMVAADFSLLSNVLALYNDKTDLFWTWFKHLWRVSFPYSRQSPRMLSQHAAAFIGHRDVLEYLHHETCFDLDALDSTGSTPLHWAVRRGHLETVRWLLGSGADFEILGADNDTALLLASARGYEQITRLLLDRGADVDARGRWGHTALIKAAAEGHEQITQLLLDRGADMDARGSWANTALMAASGSGHKHVAGILLDRGADVNARGFAEDTALISAADRMDKQILLLLLNRGADVNARGFANDTALILASAVGCKQSVQILLDNGADVNARGYNGGTALTSASRIGNEQIVRLLLDRGADMDARNEWSETALEIALDRDHKQVLQMLLEHKARSPASVAKISDHAVPRRKFYKL